MIRILLPVDGSGDTSRALDYVAERHGRGAATVSLVYVHEPPIWTHAVDAFLPPPRIDHRLRWPSGGRVRQRDADRGLVPP